jgi:hypothetical protein
MALGSAYFLAARLVVFDRNVPGKKYLLKSFQKRRGWVKEAKPVPVEKRAELAERDLILRRTIVKRDPANVLAARRLGPDMEERLVNALWGADRQIPRPSVS